MALSAFLVILFESVEVLNVDKLLAMPSLFTFFATAIVFLTLASHAVAKYTGSLKHINTGGFGECPLTTLTFDQVCFDFFLLNSFDSTADDMREYCSNFEKLADILKEYARSRHCIKGSKVVLRTTLKVAVNQQRKVSRELCNGPLKNFGKWAPHLHKISTETFRFVNESILKGQEMIEKEFHGQVTKRKLKPFACLSFDTNARICRLADTISNSDVRQYVYHYALSPFRKLVETFVKGLEKRCKEKIDYPKVDVTKMKSRTVLVPALTLLACVSDDGIADDY